MSHLLQSAGTAHNCPRCYNKIHIQALISAETSGELKMRLTVSSYSFEAIPLEGAIAIVRAMGFKVTDIGGFHSRGRASLEPDAVGENPQHYADYLKKLLDRYELHTFDYFVQFGSSPDERAITDLYRASHNSAICWAFIFICTAAKDGCWWMLSKALCTCGYMLAPRSVSSPPPRPIPVMCPVNALLT